eukprot:6277539-Ditylum_brightwellii.AAC.1
MQDISPLQPLGRRSVTHDEKVMMRAFLHGQTLNSTRWPVSKVARAYQNITMTSIQQNSLVSEHL